MAKKRSERTEDMAQLLQIPSFRRFLMNMFEQCGIFNDIYVSGDTHATARESGKRVKAMELYSEVMREHFIWFDIMLREWNTGAEEKAIDIEKESE
jgi:hypothetical protein